VGNEQAKKRWQTDGKFFRAGEDRVWLKAVTYGPFPGGWPATFEPDFSKIVAIGCNAIRLYEMPPYELLDAAAAAGLKVFGGLKWAQNADFLNHPGLFSAAKVELVAALKQRGGHPAFAGVYVGNEIPADLVRWLRPVAVKTALEALIALGKSICPQLLFAYANFPSSEYLEPENADFTAFNVYLEDEAAFRKYLRRLHHVAGDRPLVISEFGLDSRRNGTAAQAATIAWGIQAAHELETAGLTLYAWSDRWYNAGSEVLDWDFGLLDRAGNDKPALAKVVELPLIRATAPLLPMSVIVCTRNGRQRIGACLRAIEQMSQRELETIVVDDGSDDGTAAWVSRAFPWVRLLRLEPCGLSAARNAGAALANGEILVFTDDDCAPDPEWLARFHPLFLKAEYAAACGPNLPPPPQTWEGAIVNSARGAPSHVMLDDEEAEHLPGCNLAVRKSAFVAIGGFDEQFQTAGDDVDFCWRLRDAGFRLGFVPGAFVWHWRRPSILKFFQQQRGYGRAERLLLAKHPARFSAAGHARWLGFVYGGGPVRVFRNSIIYHGPMGNAEFQKITNRMLPLRGLAVEFDAPWIRLVLRFVNFSQPLVRAWVRNRTLPFYRKMPELAPTSLPPDDFCESRKGIDREQVLAQLLAAGWTAGGMADGWDVRKNETYVMVATAYGGQGRKSTLLKGRGDFATIAAVLGSDD
jgi:GT2 family glycosyltransferase